MNKTNCISIPNKKNVQMGFYGQIHLESPITLHFIWEVLNQKRCPQGNTRPPWVEYKPRIAYDNVVSVSICLSSMPHNVTSCHIMLQFHAITSWKCTEFLRNQKFNSFPQVNFTQSQNLTITLNLHNSVIKAMQNYSNMIISWF